jgi:predicted enzyme related to lactoylglutathione lyase
MDHLAIPVRDQARSRRFYETYFGFGARPAELVEESDEPSYVSVKCRDPDGYIVEASWEPDSP